MELAIKSSLTQPLPNCVNDKSMLAAIKKRDGSFRVQRCVWPPSRARVLLFAVDPPICVEAEARAFSAAGLLCTKIRSRLNDATLDTLCFLRSYYRKRFQQFSK